MPCNTRHVITLFLVLCFVQSWDNNAPYYIYKYIYIYLYICIYMESERERRFYMIYIILYI